jgi:glucose/arabinose dehydrogenase
VRITGVPDAFTGGQAGYLGLALAPDFATSRTVFMSFSEGTRDSNQTAVLRARLSDDAIALENPTVIFRATPREDTGAHFGSRLAFMADGTLIVTLGDGYKYKEAAQDTANTIGKIVRINADGTIPSDNPYASGPAPAVWSYGHRNVQGLAIDTASGRVFAHEHGPKGGDELNLIVPGQNYGWPAITYGIDYDGTVISPDNAREGMQQPLVKWVPSIAPSGMVLYTGDRYPGWQGDLFIGAMEGPAGRKLVRIDLDAEGKVAGKEHLLTAEGRPIRDVVQGPDGFLYVLTKENEGGIYRVVPKAG